MRSPAETVEVHPEEAHENYLRARAPFLRRKTEGSGLVYFKEEKVPRRPHCSHPVHEGNLLVGR